MDTVPFNSKTKTIAVRNLDLTAVKVRTQTDWANPASGYRQYQSRRGWRASIPDSCVLGGPLPLEILDGCVCAIVRAHIGDSCIMSC